jgi:tetratricopeptide (TPR) repeat protein
MAFAVAAPQARADEATRNLYKKTLQGTVLVQTKNGGWGTGWIVDKSRKLIVTNHHVTGDDDVVNVIFPRFKDGEVIAGRADYKDELGILAKVIDTDIDRDLAIVQASLLPEGTRELKLAAKSASPGDDVTSIGNPGASDALWVYTSGRARAVYEKTWFYSHKKGMLSHKAHVLETQAPTNPGDSGGPMVNDAGELVGVISGGKVWREDRPVTLMNWSIDVREVRSFLEQTRRVLDPQTADDYALRGERRRLRLKYDLALEDFTTALKMDKKCQAAFRNRGITFFFKQDYETAVQDLGTALEMDAQDAVAHQWRARSYHVKGKAFHDKAMDGYTKAISLNPKYALAYNNRGWLHEQRGERADAFQDYGRAIENDPSLAIAYTNRGSIYRVDKKYDKALEDYKAAVQLLPSAHNVGFMARLYIDAGNYDKAIEICNISIKDLDSKFATTYTLLGWAYTGKGKLDLALPALNEAVKLDGRSAPAYYRRAIAYEEQGNYEQAAADYNQAIKIDKTYADLAKIYYKRMLKIGNASDEPILVHVQFETKNTDGDWDWYPDAPKTGKNLTFEVQPGKWIYPGFDGKKIHGRRIHVWAESKTSNKIWHRDRSVDVWISPKDGYRAQKETDHLYYFK